MSFGLSRSRSTTYFSGMQTERRQLESPTDICHGFLSRAELQPDAMALKGRGGLGDTYTYRQAAQIVRQLAASLGRQSGGTSNRIGILSENCPEWPLSYLGILAAGKTVVPIDAALKADEIVRIITDAHLAAIFVSAKFEAMVVERTSHLQIYSFDSATARNWRTLLGPEAEPVRAQAGDVAALIYTSGTTGAPKVVMLTNGNILANFEGVSDALQFDSRDRFLSVLPLHHTYEAMCGFLTPLLAGATIIYARSLKSNELLEDIGHNQITVMCGVPLLFEKMAHAIQRGVGQAALSRRILFKVLFWLSGVGWRLGHKWGRTLLASVRRKAGLTTIRMFVSGGAPLPPSISQFYNHLGLDFLQGYGMTECSPVISTNRPDSIQFGSVGPPLRNLDVRIHEPDASGIGEIVVRGGSITPGYLNNPQKTAELVRDNWLYTGDIGQLKNGHLWITGRRKLVIVSAAGKNIYPEELEERLLTSPYILESIVYGRKKENKQGEEVCALIVPDLEQFRRIAREAISERDLVEVHRVIGAEIETVNAEVADYKRISRFEISLQELEKTSAKKVKRHLYAQTGNENQVD